MSEKLINIKEVALKNNCPECFSNDGLHLTFKQKIVNTKLYKSITSDISHEIECKTCHSIIYPVQWTDDIDRVFEYQKKAVTPKKSSTYLKKASWFVIIAVIIIIIAITLLIIYYTNL
ncbi:hypothetical protein A8C32_11270 [Flavivirga aquatica]|uniref:Uncharacterized protein n=1 Tax=Flavivirga aquatica TaxID=1849968 RepID=A0A1E5TD51_9FLAO|nr:hypothetical protein [Flavivirga aquatica]OEK09296.1 hypothetical protein A8C32_11270 [Flavivirga aquatica]